MVSKLPLLYTPEELIVTFAYSFYFLLAFLFADPMVCCYSRYGAPGYTPYFDTCTTGCRGVSMPLSQCDGNVCNECGGIKCVPG